MSRATFYNQAKSLAREQGFDEAPLRAQWRGTTTDFWRNKVNEYQRNIQKRSNNFNKALRISRELQLSVNRPLQLTGSSNADWIREVKRLQARGRRGQTAIVRQRARQSQSILDEISELDQRASQRERLNRHIANNNFQGAFDMAFNENVKLTERQANTLWNNLQGSGRYSLHIVGEGIDQHIAVNASTKGFIISILVYGGIAEIDNAIGFGSDVLVDMRIDKITSMTLQRINPQRTINNRDGRFFPYINTSGLDLSRYQIYNQEQAYESSNRSHCLIYTLQQQGIKQSIINSIKLSYIAGVNIRKKDLHDIAKMINRNVFVYSQNGGKIAIQKIKGRKPSVEEAPSKEQRDLEHEEFMREMGWTTPTAEGSLQDAIYVDDIVKRVTKDFNERCIEKIEEEKQPDIHIAIYANHYFTYEETEYSKYSIIHYDDLKDEEDFQNIVKKKIISNANGVKKSYFEKKAGERKINSLLLVIKFHEQGKFEKLDMVKFEETSSHIEIRDHIYLDNIDNEQRLCKTKNSTRSPSANKAQFRLLSEQNVYYGDCESFVKGPDCHELYLLGCVGSKTDCVDIYNVMDDKFNSMETLMETGLPSEQLVVNEWLKNMTNGGKHDALCYFHNLKYDYHLLESYLNIRGRCEKDGQLYNVICSYKGKTIELRDSFKLLSFSLAKFGGEFDLPKEIRKKEAISYVYYNRENNNKTITISEYSNLLSNDEKIIFNEVVKNEPSFNARDNTFNPLEYYKEYLRLDCLVLKKGLQKFNELIMQITDNKMSVYDSLTISSLTDKYMQMEGAYEGIWEVQGNLRAYIAEAVYGGRVCVNKKYQKKVIEGKISDYDGVSLYPSAISRLCRELGLPKGKAKRYGSDMTWKDKHYSIMTVKITKVNKKQQMPFIAQKEDDSSIQYINEPPKNPDGTLKPIIIDSITLEDYIKFHEIEYELLDGVYWDEGGNQKMGELTEKLFFERLQAKNEGKKALANTIKLMLNSAYGKTIMKKSKQEKVIVKTHKYKKVYGKWVKEESVNLHDYIYNNFNTIKSYRKLNENSYEIERIKADNSYNRGHIGCAILSTSKRIMNEVFDIANDHDYPIYYTDTDSLHCNYEDVPKLEAKYYERYGRTLNGKQLGQFHTDFDLEGAKDEIYATKSIFLGKKSYMDFLESKDENGNTINGYHIRLKGITKEGLEHESKKYHNSYLGLYEDLAKGIEKKIILNPFNEDENKQKVLFEFKNGKVSTRDEFIREVSF